MGAIVQAAKQSTVEAGESALLVVSDTFGDDTKAVRGSAIPFKTIEAARNIAQAGDRIKVMAGTYNMLGAGLAKNGITYDFDPLTIVNYNGFGHMLGDNGVNLSYRIVGNGRFNQLNPFANAGRFTAGSTFEMDGGYIEDYRDNGSLGANGCAACGTFNAINGSVIKIKNLTIVSRSTTPLVINPGSRMEGENLTVDQLGISPFFGNADGVLFLRGAGSKGVFKNCRFQNNAIYSTIYVSWTNGPSGDLELHNCIVKNLGTGLNLFITDQYNSIRLIGHNIFDTAGNFSFYNGVAAYNADIINMGVIERNKPIDPGTNPINLLVGSAAGVQDIEDPNVSYNIVY